jgi:hypothetical protein
VLPQIFVLIVQDIALLTKDVLCILLAPAVLQVNVVVVLIDILISRTEFILLNTVLFMLYVVGYALMGWIVYGFRKSFPYPFLDHRDPQDPGKRKKVAAVAGIYIGLLVWALAAGVATILISRWKRLYARRHERDEASFDRSKSGPEA